MFENCFEQRAALRFLEAPQKLRMLWLYRLLFLPLALLSAPYFGWRMRRRGGYRTHFAQRFGATPTLLRKDPSVRRVWVQAVSVGEMLAIGPLLQAWKDDRKIEVYLTTTTSTGYAIAADRYRAKRWVMNLAYFPVDFWYCSAKAWRVIEPDLVILTEGERWPEHMHQAARRGVPVVAINARLSDRSLRRMGYLGPLARLLIRDLTRVLAASTSDAERFLKFGVPPNRLEVCGNVKLDVTLPELTAAEAEQLRNELGLGNARLLLGASTWPGEEAALLSAWRNIPAEAGWKLLLVPRHAERRSEIESLLKTAGVKSWLRSRGAAPKGEQVDVALSDTTGELARLLALGDIVFIGKTLPPHTDGQTPVEAAVRGKTIILGPGTANFRAIASELDAAGAALRVRDTASLVAGVRTLAGDAAEREKIAAAGLRWHAQNRGAAERTREAIEKILRPAI